MSKIQRLSAQIANQIAAGEVVERPSSVVKELVENALDAGATRIQVVAAEGGRFLHIVDDGEGMTPEDAVMAFERFATSKLSHPDDLWSLTTMGFRGEALPSIASIAKVTCTTRRKGAETGGRVVIRGGSDPEVSPCGCPEGTSVRVEELFFNTPARRKFLRSDATEMAHVTETVTAIALAHPTVQLSLTVNDRLVFDTSGAGDQRTTAAFVLGAETAGQLLSVKGESPHGILTGLISPPEVLRSDRQKQWLFLNGRPVKHPTLAKAVEEALVGHIPHGRHPLYILSLEVDPSRVDVNVHPTKREVRLAETQSFFILVREAISRALLKRVSPASSETPFPSTVPLARPHTTLEESQAAMDAYRPSFAPARPQVAEPRPVYQAPLNMRGAGVVAEHREDAFPWEELRILGQLQNTFILLEHPDGLYVLDQHNSHERFLYETMTPANVPSQELLLPKTLELTPPEQDSLQDHLPQLSALGFVLDPFGESTWAIRAVPAILPLAEAEQVIRDLLGKAAEARFVSPRNREDRWRITIACHSATRAGDPLTFEQMQRIVSLWRQCEQPFTCPHGRPTGFLVNKTEFLRRCLRT